MKQIDEGYIKFNLNWDERAFNFSDEDFSQINTTRKNLFEKGLIGAYPDGIGFGNLSIRNSSNSFIISGSATGNLTLLLKEHYSLVTDYNIIKNRVSCIGLSKASSESMSHAIIYDSNPKVNAVIHIHHKDMWDCYFEKLPTTRKRAKFGTPEIAMEIKKLADKSSGIIIMGGHSEGIITYGKSLFEAEKILLNYYNTI
jgi:ribulose-5-phosphate 4-epimerase/fuculose-1-phosphate aldolase